MNLRPRFLLITALLVAVSAVAAWWAARVLAEEIVEQWAVRYAEKQVLYDKARTLQPIVRESALARQFGGARYLVEWARKPEDATLRERALKEMENFRANFADGSYFVALRANGQYYYNNAKNEYAGRQLRYVLDPNKPADKWFFDIIRQQRDMHINVNPDVELGVTKLWIDVLIRDGNDILGVAGTGFELTEYLRQVVDGAEPGVISLFVDHEGAIQLSRDPKLIDFASITKAASEHKTVALLFERDEDKDAIRGAMKEVESLQKPVTSRFVESGGRRYLAGISYLPELGWFEITLLDLDELLAPGRFRGILLVHGVTLVLALLLFNVALMRLVLRPLARLEEAMRKVREGDFGAELPAAGGNEIGKLIRHFAHMRDAVRDSRLELEEKVRLRTDALERLTKTDALTELSNRRGMIERMNVEVARGARERKRIGILWLDVDRFKEINDRHGHAAGDRALTAIAGLIRSVIRPYDSAARWGGDEFLVLVADCDEELLAALGERLREAVEGYEGLRAELGAAIRLTLSLGAYLAKPGEDLERVLNRADKALYAAKAAGRNRLYLVPDEAG